jgi:hypothetical protein
MFIGLRLDVALRSDGAEKGRPLPYGQAQNQAQSVHSGVPSRDRKEAVVLTFSTPSSRYRIEIRLNARRREQ